MSDHHHFYIRTDKPNDVAMEAGLVLGEPKVNLKPIVVAVVDNGYIRPERNKFGRPIPTEGGSDWYMLDVEVTFDSAEARALVTLLLASHHVDLAAEDRVAKATDESSTAEIIGSTHWLAVDKSAMMRKAISPSEQLGLAIKIASEVHLGQFDKSGEPYILHPLHLMQQFLFDKELAVIAVLHDVIEDSEGTVTLNNLQDAGFSHRVCSAVQLLTHQSDQDYIDDYILGICANVDAVRVKRKDLEHNSNITRLKKLGTKDFSRLEKYHNAFVMLSDTLVTVE